MWGCIEVESHVCFVVSGEVLEECGCISEIPEIDEIVLSCCCVEVVVRDELEVCDSSDVYFECSECLVVDGVE